MKQVLKKIALSLAVLTGLSLALVPAGASASIQGSVCHGAVNLDIASGDSSQKCPDETSTFNNLIRTVLIFLSAIVGAVAVIMLIVGGFRYITSGGNSENVTKAKNTIIYALIGLVIVALAQIVVQFVLNKTATAANPPPPPPPAGTP
jgi:uncharacterized membrane protein